MRPCKLGPPHCLGIYKRSPASYRFALQKGVCRVLPVTSLMLLKLHSSELVKSPLQWRDAAGGLATEPECKVRGKRRKRRGEEGGEAGGRGKEKGAEGYDCSQVRAKEGSHHHNLLNINKLQKYVHKK